jgi:hypothetical protein
MLVSLVALSGCGQRILPNVPPVPLPPASTIETSLFLIGDAGAPAAGEPVLAALGALIAQDSARSLVLFLGDNIYPRGLPEPENPAYGEALRRLDAQVDLLQSRGVRGWFLPGNHDWARFSSGGWAAIKRQDARISEVGQPLVSLEPHGGCPGPVVLDVGARLRLVLLDTQWWLQGHARPDSADDGCVVFTKEGVEGALRSAVEPAEGRHLVVAGHHPLASGGEHGGFFDWKDHLFPLRNVASWLWLPLPGLGSAYPIARNFGVTSQDIPSGPYQAMIHALSRAFEGRAPLVYAAGHDHGLQVIEGGPARWQLVSGAGIYGHDSPLIGIPGTRVALREAGFMRLDLLGDGRVRLAVITADRAGRSKERYARWLN